ncbi:membrane-associated protein, putative, partial [Bodo saltans]
EHMITAARLVGYILMFVLCVTATAVGIASIRKYRQDNDRYDIIQNYDQFAYCRLVNTFYLDNSDSSCIIQGFEVDMQTSSSSDACNGVTFTQNVSQLPLNKTQMSCWYRSLNDTTVRIVSTAIFEPERQYWFIGTALVFVGVAPPCLVIISLLFLMIRRVLTYTQRNMYHAHGLVMVQFPPTQPPAPGTTVVVEVPVVISEIHPEAGIDWKGRLLCANDFASAAVKRFDDLASIRAEECPLCFRPFNDSVVWWACGHCVCDDCNPKVLEAERRWGHNQSPRCSLCRERSDISDIVKVILHNPVSPVETHHPAQADAVPVDAEQINVWVTS